MISEYQSVRVKFEEQIAIMYNILRDWAHNKSEEKNGIKELKGEALKQYNGRKYGLDTLASGWNAAERHIQLQDQRLAELEKENARLRKLHAERLDPQQQYEMKLRLLVKQYTRSTEDIYQGHQVDIFHHPSHAEEKEARRFQTLKSAKQHYPDLY